MFFLFRFIVPDTPNFYKILSFDIPELIFPFLINLLPYIIKYSVEAPKIWALGHPPFHNSIEFYSDNVYTFPIRS